MRCQDCKTCLSAIKKGHFGCMKTFNYEKCKKAPETAALYNHLEIYNFLKTNPRQISLEKEIEFCAKNKWLDEYYAFLYSYTYFDNETKFSTIRYMMYAAIKHGDLTMMNSVYTYGTTTFHEAFAEIRYMDNATSIAVKTADPEKIESVYRMFLGRSEERERIEQRQATAAPVAPVREKVTNLQKALAMIEECDIPEGKYLELCNLLMDVHKRGVRA